MYFIGAIIGLLMLKGVFKTLILLSGILGNEILNMLS